MNQAKYAYDVYAVPGEGSHPSERDALTLINTRGMAGGGRIREFENVEPFNREKLQGAIEMAGAVCHEINQPLMAISGYSTLVSMSLAENDPLKDKLLKIMEQVDRLGQITRKLMRINRYETKEYLSDKIIDIDKSAE